MISSGEPFILTPTGPLLLDFRSESHVLDIRGTRTFCMTMATIQLAGALHRETNDYGNNNLVPPTTNTVRASLHKRCGSPPQHLREAGSLKPSDSSTMEILINHHI